MHLCASGMAFPFGLFHVNQMLTIYSCLTDSLILWVPQLSLIACPVVGNLRIGEPSVWIALSPWCSLSPRVFLHSHHIHTWISSSQAVQRVKALQVNGILLWFTIAVKLFLVRTSWWRAIGTQLFSSIYIPECPAFPTFTLVVGHIPIILGIYILGLTL